MQKRQKGGIGLQSANADAVGERYKRPISSRTITTTTTRPRPLVGA